MVVWFIFLLCCCVVYGRVVYGCGCEGDVVRMGHDCELWMSREEFLMCRALASDTGRETPDVAIRFYRGAGFNEEQIDAYKARFGGFGKAISALPDSFRRLIAGETIQINGRYWQPVVGSGHSPEHMCLYCPALKLLISGDQVLPRITPNVSVFPTEPRGDTLKDWLNSSARIRERLPDDVLVLPASRHRFTVCMCALRKL